MTIPVVETYRGVGIHDRQDAKRIEIVKTEIDAVIELNDLPALFAWAADVGRSPESRLLAAAKCEAAAQLATKGRRKRPAIDLATVKASVAGLNSQRWRHPLYFASLLDTWPSDAPGPVRRDAPLNDGQGKG